MNNEEEIKKLKKAECQKKYRESHKSKLRDYDKAKYERNKDKILKRSKTYYHDNKSHKLGYGKSYYENNSEKIKKTNNDRYHLNKSIISEKGKEYYKKNKKIINSRNYRYLKTRRSVDPVFRMIGNIRSRMYMGLKSQSIKKSVRTLELLGASKEDVWKHLESQFKEGMTRENHGHKGWHVDHVRPCSSFDLSDPEEQKKCFHYTNLQPLWWWENLSKGSKIVDNVSKT